jgi:integrase
MAGKQAKALKDDHISDLLIYASHTRHPTRNTLLVLLSVKAGLRAAEIAGLTWEMVQAADGQIGRCIELHDRIAKKGHGRRIPIHPQLHDTLLTWRSYADGSGPVITSERGGKMTAGAIVLWFSRAYRALELKGCSSHSGRRTFITRAARVVHQAGGSLRDVQLLAGHRSLQTTQGYIDGDSDIQHRLVSLL